MKERRQDKSQPSPLSCPSFPSPPRSSFFAGRSRFYNDSTSLLSKEENQSTVWSCYDKHTFETRRLCCRSRKIRITSVPTYPSGNEICETVLGRRPGYSKGLGWGFKPKARKTASASSAMASCSQSIIELQLRAALDEAMLRIEEQKRNHDALALEVERIRKLKEDMSRAQQGPPHDP
ncbi:NBS-LRR type resistance protein [Cucumis melo var. makuwa]|uniref:NBS-LRR type resistance protein n=1 Tax=Cucumis melo var. makuwa TaxID=1194695 RepID=A0A5D3DX77_CUCMM|nr:NBS-LRR type resistance protein [Cucumis melo var. makuwa]